ncbi:hypothetical protein MKEN_00824900 [Mycena kentingensis (nom. inval.)]|nr:hypothetical protein MKEN_00824900 [Mycena kentingensis (nom. inval.)]
MQNFQPPKPQPTHPRDRDRLATVCKHWLRGLCKKGDACEFLHEYNLRRMPECWWYAKYGYCSSGEECLYAHPKERRVECPDYNRGFCKLGPTCPRKHVRRVACQLYLTGFCPLGPECPRGHPKPNIPPPEAYETPAAPALEGPPPPGTSRYGDPSTGFGSGPPRRNLDEDVILLRTRYVDGTGQHGMQVRLAGARSSYAPLELPNMHRSMVLLWKRRPDISASCLVTDDESLSGHRHILFKSTITLHNPYLDFTDPQFNGYYTKSRSGMSSQTRAFPPSSRTFSASNPPPAWAMAPDAEVPTWTLDGLFLLPKARLKYYRKLYARLLKSTTPGRSDHRLLVGALDKLDRLFGHPRKPGANPNDAEAAERSSSVSPRSTINTLTRSSDFDVQGGSETSSARGKQSVIRNGSPAKLRRRRLGRVSSTTMTMPISDLERRLSTQRTLDIFTMRPKVVRLQMSPPTLHFTREFRFSMDAVIRFTPKSTGVEVVHRHGHLFLLSDLFLVCERMSPEERSKNGPDGADMWLCYPPLAGKVLRVSEVEGQDNALEIAIMRKETLIVQAESVHVRNFMLAEFKECISFAASLPPPSNQPVPPVPPIPNLGPSMDRSLSLNLPSVPERGPPLSESPHTISSDTSQFSTPSSSTSQPYFASPGQVIPPPRSMSGPGLSRAGSNTSDFQPPNFNGPPHPYNQPPLPLLPEQRGPPPPQRAPSAPMPGPSGGSPQLPYPQRTPSAPMPPRPPSEPQFPPGPGLRKSPSARSLQSQYSQYDQFDNAPPVPAMPPGQPGNYMHAPQPRNWAPPNQLNVNGFRNNVPSFHEPSPPGSPVDETPKFAGPVTSTISADMKCKVFLKQHHAQWKSLGSAKLKVYRQSPTNVKQLVVEGGGKGSIIISTIVLSDGVERVGKTGVAIELSDKGARTGIVYMIQLRSEKSAGGLFDSLLEGSDRSKP